MTDYAIELEGISKQYRIGQIERYKTLRDTISNAVSAPVWRAARAIGREAHAPDRKGRNTIWALRDVDLLVRRGEVLGVIGRNGAGKSTLLKILSRITEPTTGHGEVQGRIGSLLEVGTGFHPELTGRENVFLNGAILGMRRAEIRRKLDEIVGFAGVESFIDTPVKYYSSGMYMRLAFSVAAHIETEILLVDEVLAVGDAEFQARCLDKMGSIGRQGRTVIFVSHNIGAIAELCSRGIVIDGGRKVADKPIAEAIETYTREVSALHEVGAEIALAVEESSPCSILRVGVATANGTPATSFNLEDAVALTVTFDVREPLSDLQINLTLSRNMVYVLNSYDTDAASELPVRAPGTYRATHVLPPQFLKAGLYSVSVGAGDQHRCFQLEQDVLGFEVHEYTENTDRRGYRRDRNGVVISPGAWTVERVG